MSAHTLLGPVGVGVQAAVSVSSSPFSAVLMSWLRGGFAQLEDLRGMTRLPLVQLLNDQGQPYDFAASGDPRTYADMATPAGLAEIATYADGVGVNKNLIVPRDPAGFLREPTSLVEDAHRAGLVVHAWTFRNENTPRGLPAR